MAGPHRSTRSARPALAGASAPARQSSLREHNLALVLRHTVGLPSGATRAQTAKATGLTRATVSELVDLLLEAGFVKELPPVPSSGVGRPGTPVVAADGGPVGLGLEIAVDHVAVNAVNLAGRVITERVVEGDYRQSPVEATIERVARLVPRVVSDVDSVGGWIAGACVAAPGLVGPEPGILRFAPNLGWTNVPLADLLSAAIGWPTSTVDVGNDANLAALAESRKRLQRSHSRQEQSFLYISGEVGIGGAFVVAGVLAKGLRGWAGEIGHMVVDPAGPTCGCGSRGCLEQYAGKDVVLRSAGLSPRAGWDALRAAIDAGDAEALAAVDVAAEALGRVTASAVNLIDADTVVLGGAYASIAPALIPAVLEQTRARAIATRFTGAAVSVEGALAGEFAALQGAALSVTDRVVANPSNWLAEPTAIPLGLPN